MGAPYGMPGGERRPDGRGPDGDRGPGGRRPETVPPPKPGTAPPKSGSGTEEANLHAPATITVSLPADASLTVDEMPTASTSATRVFVSPELPRDKTFYYTLKGDIIRDGQKITASKRVLVKAGEDTQVLLDFPTTRVASK